MKPQLAVQNVTSLPVLALSSGDVFFERVGKVQEEIAKRAYELFAAAGFTNGHDLNDWYQAESEILAVIPLEISEGDDHLMVRTVVPGFAPKDLEIHVEPRRVFISGEQELITGPKEGKAGDTEVHVKRIFRAVDLPAEIDPEKARANLRNGGLVITLPRATAGKKTSAGKKAA